MNNTGWIKIYRSLLYWEWADVPEMMALWVRLLLMANHDTTTWHGVTIEAGQLVTTYDQLAAVSGLSVKQVRLCMSRLAESGQITIERAEKRQLVSISNYKQFQELENEKGQEKGTERAAKGQQKGSKRAAKGQAIIQEEENIRREELINTPLPPKGGIPPAHAVTVFDRAFEEIYRRVTGDAFVWAKRENIAVQAIVGKIVKMMEDGGAAVTEEAKMANFRAFVEAVYTRGDDWMRQNFTPHTICDKFNEYYQHLKNNKTNGKQTNNPTGVGADYLARVASELAG